MNISAGIKEKARELGFEFTGFSRAERLNEEGEKYKSWLNSSYQGKMKYLEDHFDLKLDPQKLMPGVKSVISLLYNYYPATELKNSGYKIAKYAYGKDYHKVIRKKLRRFTDYLERIFVNPRYRVFVDSAPVMERQWAQRGGLGWIGKNTLLINKDKGSYFFIADVFIDRELEYDKPIPDYCGTCRKCLDACPTDAFEDAYVLNASKCISYFTIELKDDAIPEAFRNKTENWIFGCDICQDVCPWNGFSTPHQTEEFYPSGDLVAMTDRDWENLNEDKFDELFLSSAVKRTKFKGLKRNISFNRSSKKPS